MSFMQRSMTTPRFLSRRRGLFDSRVLSCRSSEMSAQTDVLRQNLHTQLDRLIDQLADLDQTKDEMDIEEYREARQDTVDQLEEFSKSLEKMKNGDDHGLSLFDDLQRIQNVTETERCLAGLRTLSVIYL